MNVLLAFALMIVTVHLLAFIFTVRKLSFSLGRKAFVVMILDAILFLAAAMAASFYIYRTYFAGSA
jgi:hypothetical protein